MTITALLLSLYLDANIRVGLDLGIALVAFPIMVYLGASSEPNGIGKKIMSFFGLISYAVYVLQVPLILVFLFIMNKINLSPSLFVGFIFVIVLTSLSYGLVILYDLPVRKYINERIAKLLGQKPVTKAVTDGQAH